VGASHYCPIVDTCHVKPFSDMTHGVPATRVCSLDPQRCRAQARRTTATAFVTSIRWRTSGERTAPAARGSATSGSACPPSLPGPSLISSRSAGSSPRTAACSAPRYPPEQRSESRTRGSVRAYASVACREPTMAAVAPRDRRRRRHGDRRAAGNGRNLSGRVHVCSECAEPAFCSD
jgi:hypothetical protein